MSIESNQYPGLSEILNIDFLPEELNVINDGIGMLTSDIYVKGHVVSSNHNITTIDHNLSLIIFKKLGLEWTRR